MGVTTPREKCHVSGCKVQCDISKSESNISVIQRIMLTFAMMVYI
jgi:hypothetical protein